MGRWRRFCGSDQRAAEGAGGLEHEGERADAKAAGAGTHRLQRVPATARLKEQVGVNTKLKEQMQKQFEQAHTSNSEHLWTAEESKCRQDRTRSRSLCSPNAMDLVSTRRCPP